MSKYCYYDARDGTKYEAHTCTDADEEDRNSGVDLRYTIMEGGDHTVSTMKVLGTPVMGSGRG
jgi:hypothetical protein